MTTKGARKAHEDGRKTVGVVTVRRLFGQTVGDRLIATATRQEDLVSRLRDAGLVKWDPSAFSRLLQGKRGVQLEEAVALCAALETPLHLLLTSADTVTLPGGHEVPSAQIRDVVQHGAVQTSNAADTILDELATEKARPAPADQVATELGITVEELDDRAMGLWDLPFNDELGQRMARSHKAFTGQEPRRRFAGLISSPDDVVVTARQARGWIGHHLRRMTEELRNQ